jgi:hypothetical protein
LSYLHYTANLTAEISNTNNAKTWQKKEKEEAGEINEAQNRFLFKVLRWASLLVSRALLRIIEKP